MTNQCQDPTPEQEKMHEMQCEIDYLKEQLAEAMRLFIEAENHWDEYAYPERREFLNQVAAFIDQNADIVKDLNKPTI
jgi:hypothetical protein